RAPVGLQRPQARTDPTRRGDRHPGARCGGGDPRSRSGAWCARAAARRGPRAARRRGRLLVQVVSRPRGPRGSRGLRVIAGSARGRRLLAPVGDQVRPTKDMAREAMFSALDARGALDDATVLDLYAGTGALAIEALSRGAAAAVL